MYGMMIGIGPSFYTYPHPHMWLQDQVDGLKFFMLKFYMNFFRT